MLIKIVNYLLGDYLLAHVNGIVMNISILPILLSVVLSIITIYLSSFLSARKASKVSIIELIRNADEIKIKSKKLKVPTIISKVFKTGGELAYKNLKRSRKKYRTTVISIVTSIFLFITMNSLLVNMFGLTENYYEDYDYNVKIYNPKEEDINQIIRLGNIDEYFILYRSSQNLRITDLSKINSIPEIELQEDSYYDDTEEKLVETGDGKMLPLQIFSLDQESFKKYAKKIGVNYEKVKDTGILCDNYIYYESSGKQIETRIYKYSVGDEITGKIKNEGYRIKVGAITDIKPYGIEQSNYDGGYIIVNKDAYPNLAFEPNGLMIQSSAPDDLAAEIENSDMDVTYANLDASVKEEKAMVLVTKIFLYGFIAVITLIGVTNIFNTITSNMELRQKEFAMLKSIGMTKKEFNRMIHLETIFYAGKSLIYGILLGLIGTFAMYQAFSIKIESGVYIPVKPILISIVAVFVLVFMIMKYSINKINKQNTVETIRNENI